MQKVVSNLRLRCQNIFKIGKVPIMPPSQYNTIKCKVCKAHIHVQFELDDSNIAYM